MLLPKQLYGVCIRPNINHPLSPLAPCAPDAIDVKLRPMRDQIQVMRFNWTQVTCNNTEYILKLTGTLLGDSQSQFELSSYYTSVTYFEIPLPCGSSYVATVESRNAAGASDPSAPLNGTTGRLQFIIKSKRTFYISAESSNDVSVIVFIMWSDVRTNSTISSSSSLSAIRSGLHRQQLLRHSLVERVRVSHHVHRVRQQCCAKGPAVHHCRAVLLSGQHRLHQPADHSQQRCRRERDDKYHAW